MNTQELWYVSMMYTSLCGGSIDDVVGWLHNLLQALLSQRKITDGTSMVVPVLKHYKTLQGIVHSVPFTAPETVIACSTCSLNRV